MNALSSPSVTAVICAAGKGERAKMNGNKLFAPLYAGVSAADKTGTFAETAERTARRYERADGKDGPTDTTERNFRTEATDDVNGRNEQTGNAGGMAQTVTKERKRRPGGRGSERVRARKDDFRI